jgi:hypothetical protein
VEGFELDGRDVAEDGMKASLVVPGDPSRGRELELVAGLPDTVGDQLGLKAVDERFSERVVIRIADRAQ